MLKINKFKARQQPRKNLLQQNHNNKSFLKYKISNIIYFKIINKIVHWMKIFKIVLKKFKKLINNWVLLKLINRKTGHIHLDLKNLLSNFLMESC